MKPLIILALFFVVLQLGTCEEAKQQNDKTVQVKTDSAGDVRRGRYMRRRSIALDVLNCSINLDAVCALDRSEDMLKEYSRKFWAEADHQARATGSSEEESPSALVESISKIISELTDIFKSGLDGLFRDAKDNEEDEVKPEAEEEDEDEKNDEEEKNREFNGEERGKKKKKKKALMKLLLLGLVLKAKLGLLLKAFAAHLQVKFLLIALAGLFINALRLYFDLKKGHSPQKVIYYEHAQHQHHYDGGDDDWAGSSGGHWGRSYITDPQDNKSAQDLAYANQKPAGTVYSRVDDKPNYSWQK